MTDDVVRMDVVRTGRVDRLHAARDVTGCRAATACPKFAIPTKHLLVAHLGRLSAVVAHEVRHPLAGLRASLHVLDRRVPDKRDRKVIAAMIQRIDGSNEKVEDLLLYARPKAPRLHAVDVGARIARAAERLPNSGFQRQER